MTESTTAASDEHSDDRRMLAESVADFASRATDMARVRKWREIEPGYDRALWKEMAQLGWAGVCLPESCGGAGLGLGAMAVVAQGLARALVPEPVTPCAVLAARAILHCENAQVGLPLLERLVRGDLIAAVAFQETAGDLGRQSLAATAAARGNEFVLAGRKRFVAGGVGADGFVVAAKGGAGLMLVWVPAGTPGLTVTAEVLADGRYYAAVDMNDVAVPQPHLLASGELARAALDRAVDEAAVIASAELYAVMDCSLDMTLEYLRTRVQFGKPIGSFQALQHRAVDLFIQKSLASVALEDALNALDRAPGTPGAAAAASRAKARCSDAAALITRQAIQMHGAIGFTEDSDVGLYVKRAITLGAWLGNSAHHRRRYMQLAGDASD